ncbi:pirin family protein [Pendulispora albinea]|uniref:Pirin family protein n=1 Tax=Pendulispora albinea TaxID=2741071 RepID=A0ABZ2LVE4_9BACT
MVTLRRGGERRHVRRRKGEGWLTFYPQNRVNPLAGGFGILESLSEDRLPPGAGIAVQPRHDAEVVTYVLEGALAHENATGCSGVVRAGEFYRVAVGRRMRHSEKNASRIAWAHVFQIWLHPAGRLEPSREQKRFCAADRRDTLCVVASPDGRNESLRIDQDVVIFSAVLSVGQHLVHELVQGRSAWLHVVRGEATFADVVLNAGDGIGITADRAVSLTAREETEVLLLDLGERRQGSRRHALE